MKLIATAEPLSKCRMNEGRYLLRFEHYMKCSMQIVTIDSTGGIKVYYSIEQEKYYNFNAPTRIETKERYRLFTLKNYGQNYKADIYELTDEEFLMHVVGEEV